MQDAVDRSQIRRSVDFEPEVQGTARTMSNRSGKVHGREFDPPIGNGCAAAARLRIKEIGVEAHCPFEIVDRDMDMQSLHDAAALARLLRAGLQSTSGAQLSLAPRQQFSVR